MRYLIQFVVPIAIFLLVAWGVVSSRNRRMRDADRPNGEDGGEGDGTVAFVAILAIGAAVAIAIFIFLGELLA